MISIFGGRKGKRGEVEVVIVVRMMTGEEGEKGGRSYPTSEVFKLRV